jgi:Zn-dependent peptidase ImmA (M78 family)/transcriptional regulator with XRE-family HTH domain
MKNESAGARDAAPAKLIPARIKEAREARGFTLEGFADDLGVTKSAVAQYESGQISPSGEVMGAIVTLTEQPPAFFTTPSGIHESGTPFWRSLKRMEAHNRRRILRRLAWAREIVSYLDKFIDFPSPNIPTFDFDHETAEVCQIEEIADSLRDAWGLGRGPIEDLVGILEINGVTIIEEVVSCSDMDAVSCWIDGRPMILLAEEDRLGPRKNFNLAHELGHLVLHSLVELDAKNLDRVEKQANRFASAFLMPQESFGAEVIGTSLNYLISLKLRWNVAVAAIGYRAKDLGILNKHQYGYLLRQMNSRGIRKKEPYDDEISTSRPALINHAVKMLIEHGVQTKEQIASSLVTNPKDIEEICSLPKGFLDKKVVHLKDAISLRERDRYA